MAFQYWMIHILESRFPHNEFYYAAVL